MGTNQSSSMSILPWLSLVAIIWLQAINSTNSDFSAYSSHLKSRLRITQVQLNYLAVASDAGKLFGWCSGIAANRLPLPFVLLIGGAIGLVGYGVPFLFMSGAIASLSYWHAVLLSVLAGNSICWINTVCYVASLRNFPADHGTVVALSTSYAALSAKVYIALSQVIKSRNLSANASIYLLLNAVTPLAMGLISAPFLGYTKVSEGGSRAGLVSLFVVAGVTGGYSIMVSVVPAFRRMSTTPQVILLVLISSVAGVPLVKAVRWLLQKNLRTLRVAEEVEVGVGAAEVEVAEAEAEAVDERREVGVRELIFSVNFWLYFWVYLCGATLGLVYLNNLGQISQSRGVSGSVLLSISSSFAFFGKLASAPVSAFARSKYMVSRPGSIALLMAPMAGSFFLLLNPSLLCLFVSTAVIGMCAGAMSSIAVSMTAELFGRKHFSVNHNVVIANIPIGSFLFGGMAGYIYDKEAEGGTHAPGTCVGVRCYHQTFVWWGLICLFGAILSFVLYCRTRKRVTKSSSPV